LIFTECEINYNNLIESLNSYISTLSTEDEVDTYLSRNTLEDMLNIERVIKELKCSITNKINFNTKTNYIPYSWIENSTDLIVVLVRKNNDRKH